MTPCHNKDNDKDKDKYMAAPGPSNLIQMKTNQCIAMIKEGLQTHSLCLLCQLVMVDVILVVLW